MSTILDDDSDFFTNRSCAVYSKNGTFLKGYHFGELSATNYYVIFPVFLMQASLFFFVSQLVYFLLRPLKQPKVICNILTGIMLGPSLLGQKQAILNRIFPQNELLVVNTVAILGGVYFMFMETVKMDAERILRTAKYAWSVSMTCILVTLLFTFSLTRLVHQYLPGTYGEVLLLSLCIILSLAYFPVVAHAITELKLLNSELGQLAISCSVLNEMATWVFLALSMVSIGTTMQKIQSELCLCAILFITIFCIRPVVRQISRGIPEGKPVNEIYIVGLLLLPLVMGILTDMVGMTVLPGALLVGLVIPPGPPLGSALVEKCGFITSNILLPYLYMCVGQLTNVYSIKDWKACAAVLFIFVGSVLGKMLGSLLALLYFKTSTRNAIFLSLFLNLRGINELLLAVRWRMNEMIDEATYTTLTLGGVILTAIITPVISTYYKPDRKTIEASTDYKASIIPLQAMPVNTELRILCGVHYETNVHSIITLLKALNQAEISPICAYVVHLQELVGRATPLIAPYSNRRRRLFSNATDRIMRAVTNNLKSSSFPFSLQPYTMIAPYNTMHQSICRIAREKSIPLILLPFHKCQEVQERTLSLRNLNMNMQKYSPSTVGIFVDRGLPRGLNSTRLSYHVAAFFLGGPDDREAMALVSRMSGHPNVSISLHRIILISDYDKVENESERNRDDCVINEFLSKNSGRACVSFNEVVAENILQVVDAICAEENDYDLVVVGKRRIQGSRLEQEMEQWVEYKELGVIGDLLASKDFCGGNMFVLVIQYCVGIMSVTEKRISFSICSSSPDRCVSLQSSEEADNSKLLDNKT